MGKLKNKGNYAETKKKLKKPDVGQEYAAGPEGVELGVQQSNRLESQAATRLANKGNDKVGAALAGGGKRIRGRSDAKRKKVAALTTMDKTIIGSSGDKLGA
jgi:hypothetical protein